VRITNPGKRIVEREQALMRESFGKKIDDLPVWEKKDDPERSADIA
jgi:hypothetical protein